MKAKIVQIFLTALITSVIILVAQVILSDRAPALESRAHAQQVFTGNLYTLNQDTFVITSSSTGSDVYVFHFDANPEIEKSTIKFITRAQAR